MMMRNSRGPLPGNGPWRILDECEAPTHNTITAGRKRYQRPACVCPRAVLLADEYTKRMSARTHERHKRVGLPYLMPQPVTASIPDFRGGACTTPEGRKIATAGMTTGEGLHAMKDRNAAKQLCLSPSCPLLETCRAWVLGNEKPRGSWGGVYAGMDPWNRRGDELVWSDGEVVVVPFVLPVDK